IASAARALLPPLGYEVDERGERGRRLPPARIIEEGSWERRTPILQDDFELPGAHCGPSALLESHHVARSVDGGLQLQARMRAGEPTFGYESHLPPILLEFPGQHHSCWESNDDAGLIQHVLGFLWAAVRIQKFRGGD